MSNGSIILPSYNGENNNPYLLGIKSRPHVSQYFFSGFLFELSSSQKIKGMNK